MSTEDINALLRKTSFTIPVTLTDRDDEGKEVKKEIMVTYVYDDSVRQKYIVGVQELVDFRKRALGEDVKKVTDPASPVPEGFTREERRRDFENAEQLDILVLRVKGVSEELNLDYWKGVPPKHREAIVDAIMGDVFPSLKTSVG